MTFKLVSRIEETAEAWEECKRCGGLGKNQPEHSIHGKELTCPDCQGEGGRWHEAVKKRSDCVHGQWFDDYYLKDTAYGVTKSSILIREWDVCYKCGGTRELWVPFDYSRLEDMGYYNCDHCHKDADGKPTGAEPGTQGEWQVKA
jgi:hypothetical protein